jgi:hypothetical protein
LNKQSPTVLSYATPGSKKSGGLPPPFYRRSIFWIIVRRITFALGMGLFGAGIGFAFERGDAQVFIGWGMVLIGLCIPLGSLPWFMREDEISDSSR